MCKGGSQGVGQLTCETQASWRIKRWRAGDMTDRVMRCWPYRHRDMLLQPPQPVLCQQWAFSCVDWLSPVETGRLVRGSGVLVAMAWLWQWCAWLSMAIAPQMLVFFELKACAWRQTRACPCGGPSPPSPASPARCSMHAAATV